MSAHASLSPSKRHRWMRCPGSIREEARYPEQPSGPAAVDGTHSHTLLEACVDWANSFGAIRDPMDWIDHKLADHDGEFIVDSDRARRVKVATDYITKRMNEMGPGTILNGECRVDPASLTGREDLAGTIDVRLIGNGVIEIIDYKDGMNAVEADCPQLETYAIGTLAEYKGDLPADVVRMTVIQPKLVVKGGQAISTVEIPVLDLIGDRLNNLISQAAATDDPDAPLVPGDEQCRWCRHKGACNAYAQYTMSSVGAMFSASPAASPAPVGGLEIVEQMAAMESAPVDMTNDRIRQVLEAAPLLRQLVDAVEEEALRRLKAGQSIPGVKVVNGRGSRKWALGDDEIADKLKRMGLPKDAIWQTKLVSPAQIEKVTWANRKGERKQLSKRQLETIQGEYVARLAGSLTVALESDSRPAVTFDAAPMFGAVDTPALDVPDWLK